MKTWCTTCLSDVGPDRRCPKCNVPVDALGRPQRRELKPCGTPAAYRRHVNAGEPIDDACRHAANALRLGFRWSAEGGPVCSNPVCLHPVSRHGRYGACQAQCGCTGSPELIERENEE